jgi:hypothetical protein
LEALHGHREVRVEFALTIRDGSVLCGAMVKPGTSRSREDIDNRKVDFSDIASGRRLPPIHPGEILRGEFVAPMTPAMIRTSP